MRAAGQKSVRILSENECALDVPAPITILPTYDSQMATVQTSGSSTSGNKNSKDNHQSATFTFHNFFNPQSTTQIPTSHASNPTSGNKNGKNSQSKIMRKSTVPESVQCKAIGCKRILRGGTGLMNHMNHTHTYYLEIFYRCPVDSCDSRYQNKQLLVDHVKQVHLKISINVARLSAHLDLINQINGYYADYPQNIELRQCPVEGCYSQCNGLVLRGHLMRKHGYRKCEKEGCDTYTISDVGLRLHLSRDHQNLKPLNFQI